MATSEMFVNPNYKYIDKDIDTILRARLDEENLTQSNIFSIAPIGEKERSLVASLNYEKMAQALLPNRILLIPYLIGSNEDGHWVGIAIKFENNIVTRVEYYDSLVGVMTSQLIQDLKEVYGDLKSKIIGIRRNIIKQEDFASCGPCMIENLMNAAKQANSIVSTPYEIRKKHILLMRDHPLGQDCYARLLNNPQDTKKTNEVVSRKEEDLSLENNEYFFPRSEYRARFEGTSAFAMSDPDRWGTYFRSTSRGGNSDRISKLVKSSKTYENRNINKSRSENKTIPPCKTGCMRSPWIHEGYQKIFHKKSSIPKAITENHSNLYDQLLKYKRHICRLVIKGFSALEVSDRKIDVYFENDYPCIMVQIKGFVDGTQEQSSLYKIVIAYFIAITNFVAYSHKIPIELVNRASFGHNIPSVSETTQSFRISIGIVPKCYAAVLAKSLKLLNNRFLVPWLNQTEKPLKLGFDRQEILHHNEEVLYYNEKKKKLKEKSRKNSPSIVESWEEDDSLFNVLCKIGDSSGRKVSYQITRCNKYIDLLADYAHGHFFICNNTKDCAAPLRKILKKLTYTRREGVTMDISNNDYSNSQFIFSDEERPHIKDDKNFWKIVQEISSTFEQAGIKYLSNAISRKNVKGFYQLLEKANLEFIRKCGGEQFTDGYESNSDCEVEIEGTNFYSRKIILSTGMRAINVAHLLSTLQAQSKNIEIDTQYMYYETANVVLNLLQDVFQSQNSYASEELQIIKYVDLNHCAAKGPDSKVDFEKITDNLNSVAVMVLDYTSATTEQIGKAIRSLVEKVPVLILISSGIKNEQIGADMNPYGTLRIITEDPTYLYKLFLLFKIHLNAEEKLPSTLHNIRKTYKNAGAVVTSAAIFTQDRGYDYKPNTNANYSDPEVSLGDNETLSEGITKMIQLFSGEYENELNNLIDVHEMKGDDIVSWDLQKIEFLGSDDVVDAVRRFDGDSFGNIEKLYDDDEDMAEKLVEEICRSEGDLMGMDFETVKEEYEEIVRKRQYPDDEDYEIDSDENIIDIITGNTYEYTSEDYRVGFALAKAHGGIFSGISTPNCSSDEDENRYRDDTMSVDSEESRESSDNDISMSDNSMSDSSEAMDYQ